MIVPLENYLAYVATVLIFFAHPPGPGQLLFMAHSIRLGVRKALPVVAGNHTANIIQMCLAGFGLAGAIATSADLFVVVKWLGVGYLLWLGVSIMCTGGARRSSVSAEKSSSLVKQGFTTAAANPYAVMFFAALFPQFLNPEAPLSPQIIILGATYLAIDGTILLAMGASASKVMLQFGDRAMALINRFAGVLMIGAALVLATRDVVPERDH